jgi:Ca-activated chloride channel family protein
MKRLLSIALLLFIGLAALAQGPQNVRYQSNTAKKTVEKTRVLLILDCSNSMWDRWQSDAKIKVTQTVLLKFLDSIAHQPNFEVAMRVFGHLNKDAYGTKLEVPFEDHNIYKIQSKIKTLVPQGGCTIDKALTNSLNDFPSAQDSRNIILIITDGIDDCNGNICQVARQVQMSGVVVQTFILGIGNSTDFGNRLDCAGRFTYVPNEEQFTQTLYNIFSLSEEKAGLILQVTDETDHIYDADIPVVFYDAQTGAARFATNYSINEKFMPDTLTVDPLVSYDITFFTKPETVIRGKQFAAGRTSRMNVMISQGRLRLTHEQKRTSLATPSYPILVHKHGESSVLNVQQMGEQQSYLTGTYDLDVLTVPPLRLEGISIQQSANTDLTIPLPGAMSISKPRGLYEGYIMSEDNGKMKWVCDLNGDKTSETMLLMPGDYIVVLKPHGDTDYEKVTTKRFTIQAGLQTNISF